jgi:hypothetical protein
MDATQTHRLTIVQDQIWDLNLRSETLRGELGSRPAGSQSRREGEKELAGLRAEIRDLVRQRRGRA